MITEQVGHGPKIWMGDKVSFAPSPHKFNKFYYEIAFKLSKTCQIFKIFANILCTFLSILLQLTDKLISAILK